jgi:hypothetical protein
LQPGIQVQLINFSFAEKIVNAYFLKRKKHFLCTGKLRNNSL